MPRMTGNHFFAQAMKAYGVTHLFFVPSVIGGAMAEMDEAGVTKVITHGEKAAAYMADGYARACINPASASPGHRYHESGCGAARRLHGLLADDRHLGRSESTAPATGTPTRTPKISRPGTASRRRISPWTRSSAFPTCSARPSESRRPARPAPVHLELRGHAGQMLSDEADLELIVEDRFTRYPAFRLEPDISTVSAAAAALCQGRTADHRRGRRRRPLGRAGEVVELAEMLQIPVATSLNAK